MERTARCPFRPLLLVPAAVAVLVLAACAEPPQHGTRSATAGLPDLEQSLAASGWLLDPADSSLADGPVGLVTLVFDGAGGVSGRAPCNTVRGTAAFDGDDGVRIADLASTLMSCEPPVMDAEREYLDALAKVRTADVTDPDRLILSADGVRLSFTAVDAPGPVTG